MGGGMAARTMAALGAGAAGGAALVSDGLFSSGLFPSGVSDAVGSVVVGALGVATAVAAALRDFSVGRADSDSMELLSKLKSLGLLGPGGAPAGGAGASVTVVAGGAAGGAYAAVVSSVALAVAGLCGWSWATTGEWVPRNLMWVTRTRFGEAVDGVKAQLRSTERSLGGRLDAVEGRLKDGIERIGLALDALEDEMRGVQSTVGSVRQAQIEDRAQIELTAEGVMLLCEVARDMPSAARQPNLLERLSRVADATPVFAKAKAMVRRATPSSVPSPGKKGIPAAAWSSPYTPPNSPGLDCVLHASPPPALGTSVAANDLLGVESGVFPNGISAGNAL